MSSLSETQAAFREALTGHPPAVLLASLRTPADPALRLDIYRRHHRESFRRHLRGRYPTLEWLLGTDRLIALADATLHQHPPMAPSLAEYGQELIDVLHKDADLPPYLPHVARLDWHLGCLSVATDAPPLGIDTLAAVDPASLASLTFTLQPGLAFVATPWPVDDLIHLRHHASAPDHLAFAPHDTCLELKGARGRFTLRRLDPGAFTFRSSLAAGASLATSARQAIEAQASFDFPSALASLFAEGLVIRHSGESRHA